MTYVLRVYVNYLINILALSPSRQRAAELRRCLWGWEGGRNAGIIFIYLGVSQVVRTMDEINQSAQKMADIVNVIDGIAFQSGFYRQAPESGLSMTKQGFLYRASVWVIAVIILGLPVWTSAGDFAWTRDRTSTGLRPNGGEVAVLYERTKLDPPMPNDARVTQVYASRRYSSGVDLETRLCWRSPAGPCVLFLGAQLNTDRFDGLSAQGPFILVHKVKTWAGATPPLFVAGTVTVWFATPPIGLQHDRR